MNSLQSTDEISRIWREVLSNNMDSFTVVVHEYRASVSAVAYSVIGDFAASQDIAQDTFLVAWIRRNELRDASRLGAWLCAISRNLARQARRRLKKFGNNMATSADSCLVSKEPEAQVAAAKREEEQLVWNALLQLPEKYRETVALYYREGESIAQVAAVTGVSAETARQRLSRGREMLRGRVAQLIGDVIGRTKPDAGFASRVIAAIVGVGAASNVSGTVSASALAKGPIAGTAAGIAAKGIGAGVAGGLAGGLLGALGGIFGGWLGTWIPAQMAPSETERILLLERGRSITKSGILFSVAILGITGAFITWKFPVLWYLAAILAISLVFCIHVALFSLETQRLVRNLRKQLPSDAVPNQSAFGPLMKRWGAGNRTLCFQWTSPIRLLGLPLIDIRFSGGETGSLTASGQLERSVARGWIAIGDKAMGILLAIGGVATGLVSLGGVAIGGLAFGGLSIGALAIGGGAIGYLAAGGGAAGWHAMGGAAAGVHSAAGGAAIAGHAAHGGGAIAIDYATGGSGSAREFNTIAAQQVIEKETLKWALHWVEQNGSYLAIVATIVAVLPGVLYRFVLPRMASWNQAVGTTFGE